MGLWVTFLLKCLSNLLNFLKTTIKWPIMDRFWSSRCLNYHIDVPDKIGLFSSGATTSMVVKNWTKKTFEIFLLQYMPYRICSTAFISQHIWKWLTVHSSITRDNKLVHEWSLPQGRERGECSKPKFLYLKITVLISMLIMYNSTIPIF